MLLVSPQVADDDVDDVVQRFTQFIADSGGEVASINPWGRRKLAYHIADYEEASYVQANFTMEPKHAKELAANIQISEDVIRHLLVKVE
jgi:small subunit ribosomal protein S6